MFRPDCFLNNVEQLVPAKLVKSGVRLVLLDVDNTIVARQTTEIVPAARQWISELRSCNIAVCLLSNNWHRIVRRFATELDVPIVYKAIKPLPFAFIKAKHKTGIPARETLVVGDQLMTDIIGAKLLGMRSAMVLPLAKHDLKHTLLLRRLERVLLGDLKPDAYLADDAFDVRHASRAAGKCILEDN